MEREDIQGDQHVTIGLIQMAMGSDPGKNLKKAVLKVLEAAGRGARIICLPELFQTRYFPGHIRSDISGLAVSVPGEVTRIFSGIAKERGVVIIVPLFERTNDCRLYNSAVVIDADGTPHIPYHKVHIPQDPGFYEKGYFYPGDSFPVYTTRYGPIAVLICYDQWFPEAARSVALKGARIIFYPTAIGQPGGPLPEEGTWNEAWEVIQRGHAIANSVHVAAVNRVGKEGELEFFGGSFVCDAFGRVLSRAGQSEDVVIARVDLAVNETIRDSWGFFRNRRPDTYARVCEVLPGKTGPAECTSGTPRDRGFVMPAEWEPHEAVWLSWPDNRNTFPGLENVEDAYISFIASMAGSEQVTLLVRDSITRRGIRNRLTKQNIDFSHLKFRTVDYADVWIRDYGPMFITNRATMQVAMVHWRFNAWGGKYDNLLKDGDIPDFIRKWLHIPVFEPGIVLEGGSVDINGLGTIMTTRSCLLNSNRNPDLSHYEIQEYLLEYLGGTHVIWLDAGIAGDDTDGHIDDIARFAGPRTVVCAWEDDKSNENYDILRENYQILKQSNDQYHHRLRVVKLPMPSRVSGPEGRYPASYANFYIGNAVVIVPVFNDPHDRDAIRILQKEFPGRKVIGIDATAMVEGYGTFHCITLQQPKLVP